MSVLNNSRLVVDYFNICVGKQWREKQIRKISDKVFDYFQSDLGKANMTFEELYIAVLLVFK